ncbi:Diacylglycerol kinase eta [Bagarius yarrelli]|uniref:diacylglycerol kinase (ATP) n=1 Tax=Bagarius yarrelli TaxID=175774 RepID=A0A556U686_BAGYA|nr:Diacylglycerol kinase eta [Bagarius yarrelli]
MPLMTSSPNDAANRTAQCLFIAFILECASMATKPNPNTLYVREPERADAGDESSDSDGEPEESSHKLIRKVSTSGQIRAKCLRGVHGDQGRLSEEDFLERCSGNTVRSTIEKDIDKNTQVITPFRKLMLCAESRKEMEDWITALKSVQKWETYEASQFNMEHFSGMHNWYACSHARPTFCNVCREALPGVTSHGLSCEVCKFKAHKRCAVRSTNNCKWTTLASIGNDIIEVEDGGNLPVSAKCVVCDRTCGSVRRLQDWRCLWCKAILGKVCPLGQCKVSIIPPTALNSIDSDGFWKATSPSCSSPLLVLVNSKSGDNQGVKFLRKFKQLLNPAQVFDLMNGGPQLGFLCGTVNEFVAEVGKAYEKATENKEEADVMAKKCAMLNEKLDSLVQALSEEADAELVPAGSQSPEQESESSSSDAPSVPRPFRSKEQLMLRANSLKKALRQIIEQAEKVVDEQNRHTQVNRMSSSSSIKRGSSEDLKEAEPRQSALSPTTPIVLEKADSCNIVTAFNDEQCTEKCVMNNYFGIGLDAKISLEFNNKRDEHPKKCSSRTKNMMWYGVLGTKELVQKTYKNLEQRVQLECPCLLPSLQGLAVLNIPSYAGGILLNFWGGTKEDNNFGAPSFDDKKLEVVAVFGSMQMAMSRVDGEAWIQPPGIVQIIHKNRAQMLTRDRVVEQELAHAVNASAAILTEAFPSKPSSPEQCLSRSTAVEIVNSSKVLQQETKMLLEGKLLHLEAPQEEELLSTLNSLSAELIKLEDIHWICPSMHCSEEDSSRTSSKSSSIKLKIIPKVKKEKEKLHKQRSNSSLSAERWGAEEVGTWLDSLGLGEYRERFVARDIQGWQLAQLQRQDLKDLGISKVGHVRRILQAIEELDGLL